MYDRLLTVSHAFGLMARNALIASLERRAKKDCLGLTLFFGRKIVDFPSKKQRQSDRFSPRTPFGRSEKQCVTHHKMFIINFVSLLTL